MKFILLALLAFTPTNAQVRTKVNPTEETARTILENRGSGKEDSKLIQEFELMIHRQVVSEIEAEAKAKAMTTDQYVGSMDSVTSFTRQLNVAMQAPNMSDAKALVLLKKASEWLRIHKRYNGSNYTRIEEVISLLTTKTRFFSDRKEERLFYMIDDFKKNSKWRQVILAEGNRSDCYQNPRLNPFAEELLKTLQKTDQNWGYLSKDDEYGVLEILKDKIAYKNEDGSIEIYDVVYASCGGDDSDFQPDNYKKLIPSEETKKYHWHSWLPDTLKIEPLPPKRKHQGHQSHGRP